MTRRDRSIAIAHDQFKTYGGAERVAAEIARLYDAPIYTTVVTDEASGVPDDLEVREIASPVGRWCMRRHYLVEDAYQMLAWPHVPELYEYDIVIQTKTNPYWFVPKDTQTVVRYCHSTPRGLYDRYHQQGGHWFTDGLKLVQRMLYQQVLPYADRWMANSDVVARRLERYFGIDPRDIDVVYPGVEVSSFGADLAETRDYLFTVGRLATNKRVDLIREVARATDRRVVVAGSGSEKETLLDGAPPNLEHLGYVSEAEKAGLLSGAAACLFFGENEDFGIVPIEAFASGTPVIGVDEGFTRHQVRDGENGFLCEPTVKSATRAIDQLYRHGVTWDEHRIERYARQFSRDRFQQQFRESVERAVDAARVRPAIEPPELEVLTDA